MDKMDSESKNVLEAGIKFYELYRQYVTHEDNLTNNRMTWLLTIHGFLYATYGFTLQKKFEIYQKVEDANKHTHNMLSSGSTMLSSFKETRVHTMSDFDVTALQIDVFLFCIAGVGICISLIAWIALDAAKKAIMNLRINNNIAFDMREDASADFKRGVIAGRLFRGVGVRIKAKHWLPQITGGGIQAEDIRGFYAPEFIPKILIGSWVISLIMLSWTSWHPAFQ